MSWNQITIDVPDDLKDTIVGELSDNGVAGLWESVEPRPGETRLVAYFDVPPDISAIERRIKSVFDRLNLRAPPIIRGAVAERDWTEEWKKSYSSFAIGDDFFVIPSWSDSECPDDRLPIHIDPGQAFGTGTHETTQLTIEALERWVEPQHVVLDLGTGSGILAIASRLLGAREVFACDIDPVSVTVAEANIKRNAEHEVWTFCGSIDAVRRESIHLVLCNLTAELIVQLFPQIDRVLRPCGYAIFSGILNQQNEEVRELIHRFRYSIHEELIRGEWHALVAEKNVG